MPEPRMGVAATNCYFCGEPDRIVISKVLTEVVAEKVEEMHNKVIDMEPCTKCQGHMKLGIIILVIDEDKSEPGWDKEDIPNPYRTGQFLVIQEEACEKFMPPDVLAFAKKHRFMFADVKAANMIGLVKGEASDGATS